jgi:hypothetical protein
MARFEAAPAIFSLDSREKKGSRRFRAILAEKCLFIPDVFEDILTRSESKVAGRLSGR